METPRRILGLVAALTWPWTCITHASSLTQCFDAAGHRYGIAPTLLRAIAAAESGLDPRALHANTDGTRDVGLMQINSWWLSLLKRHGIEAADLWDPCLNIDVGAWILAVNIRRYGYGWRAVGAYHAGTATDWETERRREEYAIRIQRHLACGGRRMCGPAAERD